MLAAPDGGTISLSAAHLRLHSPGGLLRTSIAADEVSESTRHLDMGIRHLREWSMVLTKVMRCRCRMLLCWHALSSQGPETGLLWAARTAHSTCMMWPPAEGSLRFAVHLASAQSVCCTASPHRTVSVAAPSAGSNRGIACHIAGAHCTRPRGSRPGGWRLCCARPPCGL
jgi:hypothetical protein